jgi:hypothetical protein
MRSHIHSFLRWPPAPVLALALVCVFACFSPGGCLRAGAAQITSPNGAFGFMVHSEFSGFQASGNATGIVFLGVMNFDGAGNVTGPYTYEVDSNNPKVPKTTPGAFTGTYTINPDGTGSISMNLDNGMMLTLAMVVGEGGQSIQLVASNFTFPAPCGCNIDFGVFSGIARAMPAASLSGAFAYQTSYVPNASGSLGVLTFDGAGNVSISAVLIGTTDNNGQPAAPFPYAQSGTYTVNPDGTGSFSLAAVTGVTNATTYAFVTTDNGSGMLLMQTDRPGSGANFGIARQQ